MQIEEASSHPLEKYFVESSRVKITVRPHFLKDRSNQKGNQFFYVYKMQIENLTDEKIKIIFRHFLVRDGNKKEYLFQGPGVMNEKPVIAPRLTYDYQSLCPLPTAFGNLRGKLEFEYENGETFWEEIPLVFFRPLESFLTH